MQFIPHYAGFSLLEILICLLIISAVLLGLDAMQLTTLTQVKHAYSYAVAEQQIYTMAEELLTWKEQQLATKVSKWNQQNAELLIEGQGVVTGHYPNYQLRLNWGEKNNNCTQTKLGKNGCIQVTINA